MRLQEMDQLADAFRVLATRDEILEWPNFEVLPKSSRNLAS
jgi:hypothetical protein